MITYRRKARFENNVMAFVVGTILVGTILRRDVDDLRQSAALKYLDLGTTQNIATET